MKSLRPLVVLAVLTVLTLAMAYVAGYFALSFPHSTATDRIFAERWQYELYTPMLEVESGMRGDGFRVGYKQ